MYVRTIVTLAALLCLGTTSASDDPHTIDITVTSMTSFEQPHLFLGIAVLGHHVGRLESGWLVKQSGPGYLHIDWTKAGNWDGLSRTDVGPRDVSQGQLDAVVRVVESLGYAPSAIRAWRTVAPVGYDGFHEGDTALTIGEILVDLGTPAVAGPALQKWWSVIGSKSDPFDALPSTNVRYASELYVQPDCTIAMQTLHDSFVAQATQTAVAIATAAGTTTTLARYAEMPSSELLCPSSRQPNFMNAGIPPIRIADWMLKTTEAAHLSFSLPHASGDTAPQALSANLASDRAIASYAFALPERYVATIGCEETASAAVAESRRKAESVARAFHVRIGALIAARAHEPPLASASCRSEVDAAWALDGASPPARAASQPAPYTGTTLIQAAQAAAIDDPRIVSAFELEPSPSNETLVLQR